MTAETPYESRYFSVTLDGSGNILATDMNNIVSVDSAQAESYAEQIMRSGKTKGFIRYFRWKIYPYFRRFSGQRKREAVRLYLGLPGGSPRLYSTAGQVVSAVVFCLCGTVEREMEQRNRSYKGGGSSRNNRQNLLLFFDHNLQS